MRRFGVVTASLVLAAVGALGLTGCGLARGPAPDAADRGAGVEAEGQALLALGVNPVDLPLGLRDPRAESTATPGGPADESAGQSANQSAEPGERRHKRHPARALLRKNTLHGEIVVQTKDGTRTIAVQRGTVTAIDADSMTVRSTDGFTMTWTFGDKLRVIERRTTVQPEDVKVGAEVGVAGAKEGDGGTARLIVIPRAR